MRIHNGEIRHLSVSLPPRAGKSYITSLFCAWTLAKRPTESVMRNTCTARLYEKFSYDVRNIIREPPFREVFFDVELAPDKQSVNGWSLSTSRQVGYFGAGLTGTIIGFGATALAITDDMYKSLEDALSDNMNDKILSWEESAHESRMEKRCPRIDIGTRWRKNDLIGRNIERKEYDESIIVPALDQDGKSFCDDVKSTAEYLRIKDKTDSQIWDAEYMQEPIEAKGVLFPKGELRYYKPDSALLFETSLAYCDVADQGDDNLSAPNGRHIGSDVYITDWLFCKDNSDITLPLLAQMITENSTKYIRVESNSMGAIYSRDLMKITKAEVYQAHSSANKHTRILMDAGFVKKHFVFLHPDYQDSDYKSAMDQMCGYLKNGKSNKDDAPDSISGLATFIRTMFEHLYR